MQCLQKSIRDEVDLLPADKRKSFLQSDSITLGLCTQACPKYPKQQVKISLQYLKENMKDEVNFLPSDKLERFLQIDIIILGVCARYTQITENNKFAISLQYLKKEVSDEVDFLHGDNKHENLLQINTMTLMGMLKHSLPKIASFQCLNNISKKG